MLLDAWAIPCCMFFSFVLMRTRYKWSQLIGIFICIGGLALLVGSDQITNKDYPAAVRLFTYLFLPSLLDSAASYD